MNKISKLSNLLVLSMAAAIPLLAPTAQAQRFSTSEQTIAESSSFLDAHPDLRFRAKGAAELARGDHRRALASFTRAARYADKFSQAMLAAMYWEGNGVERNPALAYAWADLAAERGYPDFLAQRERYWAALDPALQTEALRFGATLYSRFGDHIAEPRLGRLLKTEHRRVVGSRTGYTGHSKIFIPNPIVNTGGAAPPLEIDGSQFFAAKFWVPAEYRALQDADWQVPRIGRVDVGEFETGRASGTDAPTGSKAKAEAKPAEPAKDE